MRQLITPTPVIPATGGWCLQYVRQAFGLPAKYGSATEAWDKSTSQHRDRNFPPGLWVPVWYGIAENPLGHVILLAPDRTVYSTSDYSGWPVHHDSLADLEAFYARYGLTLQYRGWTEDVASYAVIAPTTISAESSTIKPFQEDTLSAAEVQEIKEYVHALIVGGYKSAGKDRPGVADAIAALPNQVWEATVIHGGTHSVKTELVKTRQEVTALRAAITALAKNPNLTADQITEAVKAGLAEAVVDVDVNVNGKATV